MSRTLASFRELKGIGPATEARLHQAGVGTWEALSQVLAALASMQARGGEAPAELVATVAARAATEQSDPGSTATATGSGDASTDPDHPDAPAATHLHRLVLDAGRTVGGNRRPVEVTVTTAGLDDMPGVEYQARLAGRALGSADADGWADLAGCDGHGLPPEPLALRFDDVPVPAGVQRLQVRLDLRLPQPLRELPAMAVLG